MIPKERAQRGGRPITQIIQQAARRLKRRRKNMLRERREAYDRACCTS
jgi:hypothetical protein